MLIQQVYIYSGYCFGSTIISFQKNNSLCTHWDTSTHILCDFGYCMLVTTSYCLSQGTATLM